MQVFPADTLEVEPLIHELQGQSLIVMYEVAGSTYVWIPGFAKHQRPHPKEAASTLPPYPGNGKVEPRSSQPVMAGGSIPSDIRNPDVLNADVLNPDTPVGELPNRRGGDKGVKSLNGVGEKDDLDKKLPDSPPQDPRSFDTIKQLVLDLATQLRTTDPDAIVKLGGASRRISPKQARAAIRQLREDGKLADIERRAVS